MQTRSLKVCSSVDYLSVKALDDGKMMVMMICDRIQDAWDSKIILDITILVRNLADTIAQCTALQLASLQSVSHLAVEFHLESWSRDCFLS
jgi:hypothetical protein